jgi:hypothetical protein
LIDFLGCHTRQLSIRQHIYFDLLNVSDPKILFVFADLSCCGAQLNNFLHLICTTLEELSKLVFELLPKLYHVTLTNHEQFSVLPLRGLDSKVANQPIKNVCVLFLVAE